MAYEMTVKYLSANADDERFTPEEIRKIKETHAKGSQMAVVELEIVPNKIQVCSLLTRHLKDQKAIRKCCVWRIFLSFHHFLT